MQNKQIDLTIEQKIFRPFPTPSQTHNFPRLEPEQQFKFPLEKSEINDINLVIHSQPQYLNKYITDAKIPSRIITHKNTVCMLKGKELLIGSKKLRLEGISCFAYNSTFLIVAFENLSLNIYGQQLKLLKQIPKFSEQVITEMHIVTIYSKIDAIILLTTSGKDITIKRIEKGFFSSWSCKYSRQVANSKDPYTAFIQLPGQLKQKYTEESYPSSTLIGCISSSQIYLLKINANTAMTQNFISNLFSTTYSNSSIICSGSWGEIQIQDQQHTGVQQLHLTLTYSMGKHVYQLQLFREQIHNNDQYQITWKESKPMINDKIVAYCQQVTSTELLIIYQDGSNSLNNIKNIDWSKSIKVSDAVNNECQHKLKPYVFNFGKQQRMSYSSTMFYQTLLYQTYHLSTSNIGAYELATWKKVCEQLRQKTNLEGVMRLLASIHLKLNKYTLRFGGTQKQERQLHQQIQKAAIQYLHIRLPKYLEMKQEQIIQRIDKQDWMKVQLSLPIQLLVRTDEYQFIFDVFKKSFQQYLSEKVFYKVLQLFITHSMIKFIPDEDLPKVFNYYLHNQQPQFVEKLAIGFDLSQIEKSIVIHYCLENVLVHSLAYICTQGNQSQFVTPLVKFYGVAEIHRIKNQIQKAKTFASHALWYIDLCIHRDIVTLNNCSDEVFGDLISTLTMHLFTEKILVTLFSLELQKSLNILSNYFTLQNATIIMQYCVLKITVSNAGWINSNPSRVTLEVMLSVISKAIEICKSKTQDESQRQSYDKLFTLFISKIIINKTIKLKKQKYMEILQFLIKDNQCIKLINYGYAKTPEDIDHKEEISHYINKVFMQSLNEVVLSPEDLELLQKSAQSTGLIEVQVYIYYMAGNYGQALNVYLKSNSEVIFKFIENTFKLLGIQKRNKDKRLFQKQVKKRISPLVMLNAEKATQLAKVHFPNSEEQFLAALEGKKQLQLQFLQKLIHSRIQISQKSSLLFVELRCSLNPSSLLFYLKTYPIFPIQQTLKICQKHNAYQCLEHLYDKMGLSSQSIVISVKRISLYLQKQPEFSNQNRQYVQSIIQSITTLCIKNKSQQLWQQLFDSMIVISKKYAVEWQQVFQVESAKIFHQLLLNCPLNHCIQLIKTKYNSLLFTRRISLVFSSLFRNYLYNQNMMFYAIDYDRAIIFDYQVDCAQEVYKGCIVGSLCENCEQSIDKSKQCLSFRCGHSYHKQCTVKDDSSYVCVKCVDKQPKQFQLITKMGSSPTRRQKPGNLRLVEQANELKQSMIRKFSEEQTQYEQQQLDNQKEEKVIEFLQKLDYYENVRKAVDEISDNILQRLQRSMKFKK